MSSSVTIDQALEIGLQHFQAGQTLEALHIFEQILAVAPSESNACNLKALCLTKIDRLEEALTAAKQAVALQPSIAQYHASAGEIARRLGRTDESEQFFQTALSLEPDDSNTFFNLGKLYTQTGRVTEAIDSFTRVLTINPGDWESLYNLGNLHTQTGELERAHAFYQQADQLRPHHPDILNNWALLYLRMRQPESALSILTRLVSQHPSDPAIRFNLANAHKTLHHYDQAVAEYSEAARLKPDFHDANINQAFTLLASGDFKQGFTLYEQRASRQADLESLLRYPGSLQDLTGKSLLVLNEQGFGDTLMFARFLKPIAQVASSVSFLPQTELQPLFLDHFSGTLSAYPADRMPDFTIKIGSLPYLLGVDSISHIDSTPYLKADSGLSQQYRQRYFDHHQPKIGLCWQGNPEFSLWKEKAVTLELLQPILEISEMRFYALQLGFDGDLGSITDLQQEMQSFKETSALLDNLDHLITIDTAVAHLAGATGIPTTILLPWQCDWRWQDEGETSYWYDSVTLLREDREQGFTPCIAAIRERLLQMRSRSSGLN